MVTDLRNKDIILTWISNLSANHLRLNFFEEIIVRNSLTDVWQDPKYSRSSHSRMFFKIGVLKNFAIFNFIKKRLQHRCFPVNIAKFIRPALLRTPPVAASDMALIIVRNSSFARRVTHKKKMWFMTWMFFWFYRERELVTVVYLTGRSEKFWETCRKASTPELLFSVSEGNYAHCSRMFGISRIFSQLIPSKHFLFSNTSCLKTSSA